MKTSRTLSRAPLGLVIAISTGILMDLRCSTARESTDSPCDPGRGVARLRSSSPIFRCPAATVVEKSGEYKQQDGSVVVNYNIMV